MRYISLDLETTSKNPQTDQILEIGMIDVNTLTHPSTWKTFHAIINYPRIEGEVFALDMNSRIINYLKRYNEDKNTEEQWTVLNPFELLPEMLSFIKDNGYIMKNDHYSINIAGKNVASFDIPFLKEHFKKYNGNENRIEFIRRTLDPAILYADFFKDERLPDLKECKIRAGLNSIVTHNALEDAWDIVYLICNKIGYDFEKTLTEENLDLLFDRFETNGPYIYWALSEEIGLRTIKNKNHYMYQNIFNSFEIGNPLEDNWKYIWNIKEIENFLPEFKYEA